VWSLKGLKYRAGRKKGVKKREFDAVGWVTGPGRPTVYGHKRKVGARIGKKKGKGDGGEVGVAGWAR